MIHILGKGAIGTIFSNALRAKSIPCSFEIPTSPSNLLVCVKNHQVESALERIPATTQVTIMTNGSLSLDLTRYPHLIYGSTSLSGYIKDRVLVQTGTRGETLFNPTHDCAICSQMLVLLKSLTLLNPVIHESPNDPDFKFKLLLKIGVNAIINPITAMKRKQNGQVDWTLYAYIAHEIEEIYSKNFCRYPSKSEIMDAVLHVASVTSTNKSSMLIDVENGKQTEIEGINGWLVKIGRDKGLETRVNQDILERIRNLTVVFKEHG